MFWTEDIEEKTGFQVPDRVLDVVYRIHDCKSVPMEHAHALAQALQRALPWLAEEDQAGIHPIYGAESGNGWERPNTDVLYVSRRQKLTLRLPRHRLEDAQALVGQTLDIAGHSLAVGQATTRKLSDLPTLYARHVVAETGQGEDEFLRQTAEQLQALGIPVKKMMCGKEHRITLPDRELFTRSLMLADLDKADSVRLQEVGLGEGRQLGCGLFVPQKGIKAVRPD